MKSEAAIDEKNWVADPGRVAALTGQIRSGELTPTELVDRCLQRMREAEPAVQAWREVDAERALAQAQRLTEEASQGRFRGPLHGIPIGVKDIIDVAGLPTRANRKTREKIAPAPDDEEVEAAQRAAGAIVLGKTHTTEFAFFDPSPARNPHHTDHTPGGSSSGSAAAVAAGTVPLSLGTQTAGSVNRPAMYCGVAAFKPSTQLLSIFGILPLAPTFDTVGCFGYTVADAVACFEALCPGFLRHDGEGAAPRQGGDRIVVLDDPIVAEGSEEVRGAVERVAERLGSRGFSVRQEASPVPFREIRSNHWLVLEYEMGRIHAAMLEHPPALVGEKLRETIAKGGQVSDERYHQARAYLSEARQTFWSAFSGTDALLFPVAPQTAPRGLEWTGDPKFLTPWTALGGPQVSVPAGYAAGGLPVGVLLCGSPGSDLFLGRLAVRLADALD